MTGTLSVDTMKSTAFLVEIHLVLKELLRSPIKAYFGFQRSLRAVKNSLFCAGLSVKNRMIAKENVSNRLKRTSKSILY